MLNFAIIKEMQNQTMLRRLFTNQDGKAKSLTVHCVGTDVGKQAL